MCLDLPSIFVFWSWILVFLRFLPLMDGCCWCLFVPSDWPEAFWQCCACTSCNCPECLLCIGNASADLRPEALTDGATLTDSLGTDVVCRVRKEIHYPTKARFNTFQTNFIALSRRLSECLAQLTATFAGWSRLSCPRGVACYFVLPAF